MLSRVEIPFPGFDTNGDTLELDTFRKKADADKRKLAILGKKAGKLGQIWSSSKPDLIMEEGNSIFEYE